MSRIWAVARHMIAEGIRMKIALVFIGVIVIMLPVLPFAVAGDGLTLKSRVQSFLSYSLGGVGFLLSMLTVFLSCGALYREIHEKSIFMIVSKPIPRWQFLVGKWLGISVLNAGLLAFTGLAVLVFTWHLKQQPTSVPDDREALQYEVLNARHAFRLQEPNWSTLADDAIRRLREEGRLDDLDPTAEASVKGEKMKEIQRQWRTLQPGEERVFAFEDLLVDREKKGFVHLHFKPTSPTGADNVQFQALWEAGDPREPNTLTNQLADTFIAGRFHTVPIPTRAVNSQGTLYIHIRNIDRRERIAFEGPDSLELLMDIGTFHWNLFRALTVVWCRLAFLAVLGLAASTFLSFPVACMGCFLVLLTASSAGFLGEAVDWSSPGPLGNDDPLWVVGPVLRPIARGFVWLVPDFSKFDPTGNVVNGRLVPLMWVLQSVVVLVFMKGLALGVLGSVILTKRELAQVVA